MKKNLLTFLLFVTIVVSGVADENIKMYHEKNSNNTYSLFVDNTAFYPIYISVTLPVLENFSVNAALPYEIVVSARSSRNKLFDLTPINTRVETRFSYLYKSQLGDPINTTPDISFLYLFPFAHGQKFRVGQAFNGTFSHFGENQYAVDFSMPVGTPLHASRAGIVIAIKKDSNVGGNDPRYANDGNYVMIYHSDGTIGTYLHLMYNGVVVALGQSIEESQLIVYSGNTGLSTEPHLHFVIFVPQKNANMKSIPFRFIGNNLEGVIPQQGEYYESIHRR